jgi:pimeloyl-ACP methyl ester carboxylesterase
MKQYIEASRLTNTLNALKTTFNYRPQIWAINSFEPNYKVSFVPTIPTLIIGGEYDYITPLYLFKEDKRFQAANFNILEIKDAGHFSWLEKPLEVSAAIKEFVTKLD